MKTAGTRDQLFGIPFPTPEVEKTPEELARRVQRANEINQEVEYDRLYREAPKMIKALIEFRESVQEFRTTGKLDYRRMFKASDDAQEVIARADRRQFPR